MRVLYEDFDNSTSELASEERGVYTFVAADDTAGTKSLTMAHIGSIKGAIVRILTSAGVETTSDVAVTWSGNVLTIADGSTKKLTATDVAYFTVWGVDA